MKTQKQVQNQNKTRRIKLCVVGHKYFPMGVRQLRHSIEMIDMNMEIDAIVLKRKDEPLEETYRRINIFRIKVEKAWKYRNSRLRYIISYVKSLIFMCIAVFEKYRQNKYDIVYIFTLPDIMLVAGILPKLFGAKIIADHLDPMPELYLSKFYLKKSSIMNYILEKCEKHFLRIADTVLTQNDGYKDLLIKRGTSKKKIQVIHNMPDPKFWGEIRSPSKCPVDKGGPIKLTFHGTITERSGLLTAIRAVSILKNQGIKTELTLFDVGDYQDVIKNEIYKLKLYDSVLWIRQMLPIDMPQHIEKTDLGLLPNISCPFTQTNLPNRIFEFLWLGKPVVASRTDGVRRYFPENTVFYYHPESASDLAEKIVYAIESNEAESKVLGGQRIMKNMSWDNEKSILKKVIQDLMKSKGHFSAN